jgi:hypothetical protein
MPRTMSMSTFFGDMTIIEPNAAPPMVTNSEG